MTARLVPMPVVAAMVGVAGLYSWTAAGFHPFTWPMRVMVALPILVALALAWGPSDRAGRTRHESIAGCRPGFAVWAGLFTLAAGWQLAAYLSSPRHDHPTLSSLANDAMSRHAGRSLFFALWLALGWALLAPRLSGHRRWIR